MDREARSYLQSVDIVRYTSSSPVFLFLSFPVSRKSYVRKATTRNCIRIFALGYVATTTSTFPSCSVHRVIRNTHYPSLRVPLPRLSHSIPWIIFQSPDAFPSKLDKRNGLCRFELFRSYGNAFFLIFLDRPGDRSTPFVRATRRNGKKRKVCHRTTFSSSSGLLMVLPVRISAAKSSPVKFQEPANLLPRDEKRKDNKAEEVE